MIELLRIYGDKVGFFYSVIAAELLFAHKFDKRKFFWLRVAASFIFLNLWGLFAISPLRDLVVKANITSYWFVMFLYFALMFATTLGVLTFCFNAKINLIVLCGVIGYSLESFSYGISELMSIITHIDFAVYFPLRIITYIICFAAFYFGGVHKFRANIEYLDVGNALVVSGVILFCVLFVGTALEYNLQKDLLWVVNILRCFICGISIYAELSAMFLKKKRSEVQVMSKIIEKEKEHYESSQNLLGAINLKLHDLKYYALKTDSKPDMSEIVDNIKLYDANIETGNTALDVVLTENMLRCYKEKIDLTCMADGKLLYFMEEQDIYNMFGNILDNAEEAVKKVEDSNKWKITLTVTKNRNFACVHCENYYDGKDIIYNGKFPTTTKPDKFNHGYGVKSISLIAEKYGGNLCLSSIDDTYHVDISIPLPKEAQSVEE